MFCLLFMATSLLRSLDFPIHTLIDLMLARPPRELLSILTGHEKNDLKENKDKNPTNYSLLCWAQGKAMFSRFKTAVERDRPWVSSETLL